MINNQKPALKKAPTSNSCTHAVSKAEIGYIGSSYNSKVSKAGHNKMGRKKY